MATATWHAVGGLMVVLTAMSLVVFNLVLMRSFVMRYEFDRQWYLLRETTSCTQPEAVLKAMAPLVADTSQALSHLGAASVVCFGTLIGALRRGDVLPWDNNVDLCIVNQIPTDFQSIQTEFNRMNICILPFDSWTGEYQIERDGIKGSITVFTECPLQLYYRYFTSSLDSFDEVNEGEKTPSWLCPSGALPYSAQVMHSFTRPIPGDLLEETFPKIPLGSEMVNITHGDGEILKYLYPDSWWLDIRPVGCRSM